MMRPSREEIKVRLKEFINTRSPFPSNRWLEDGADLIDRIVDESMPNREEIEKAIRTGGNCFCYDCFQKKSMCPNKKAVDNVLSLLQYLTPIWCKRDCPKPWKWENGQWTTTLNDDGRVLFAYPLVKFCPHCGARRPEVNNNAS